MLKRMISTVLVVAILALIAGCAENEYKSHRQTEVRDQVIQQDTVVK